MESSSIFLFQQMIVLATVDHSFYISLNIEMATTLKYKTRFFKALSDPNRLRILKMLQAKQLCVCEITAVLQLATSTVSRHLSILKEAGFIIEEKDGKWINYRINPSPKDPRILSVLSMLDFWIADEAIIRRDLEKAHSVDRVILSAK